MELQLHSTLTGTKGYLVLIGGAEDKKEDKIVLRRIVELNNAKHVVVVPTASEYPGTLADAYNVAFTDLGVEQISVFDIRNKEEADKQEYFDKLDTADLLFFTGGDQVRLVNSFLGTKLLTKIINRHENNRMTIAGTSAGAAAACDPLIYDGDYLNLIKGSISIGNGFGFIHGVTIDTHFVNRGRIGRLSSFLCSGYSKKGIGLGEDTGVIISPDNVFEAIGSGIVSVIDSTNLDYTNYDKIPVNGKIVLNGLVVGFLQPGTIFDINTWKVISAGQERYFIPSSVSQNIDTLN